MTQPPKVPQPLRAEQQDDAERRRRALEQLRRNLLSAVKQVENLQELDARRDREQQAA